MLTKISLNAHNGHDDVFIMGGLSIFFFQNGALKQSYMIEFSKTVSVYIWKNEAGMLPREITESLWKLVNPERNNP